jgi:hypothetical protein
LFKYAIERAFGKIIIQMAGDSDQAAFVVMLLLPVASSHSYHELAVLFNHFNDLFDFHAFVFCRHPIRRKLSLHLSFFNIGIQQMGTVQFFARFARASKEIRTVPNFIPNFRDRESGAQGCVF